MRNSDPLPVVDWISVSLRWFTLVAFAMTIGANQRLTYETIIIFIGGALWNILLTFYAALNRRLWAHRFLILAGDLVISNFLFFLSGDVNGVLGWAGLLPLLTGTLYFQMRGALWLTLINLIMQGGLSMIHHDLVVVAAFLGPLLLFYFGLGLLLGFLSLQLNQKITHTQQKQILTRRESELASHERNQSIFKLVSTLNKSLNYQRVMEAALDLGFSTLGGREETENRLVSGVFLYTAANGKGTELQIGASRRFTPADTRITLSGTSGLIGKTIDEGKSHLGKGLSKDPELGRIVALRACRSAYCIPLSSGLETYGVLLYAHPDENYFSNDKLEVLDIIGNQANVAMQNARLYRDLELEKERMTEIQEEARKKLARDLHDGPTQSVAALAMRVNFARRLMERNPAAAADELFKVEDLARRTTKEIRHMLFTLRPLVLESQGLIAALESMAEKMQETYNQKVIIEEEPKIVTMLEAGKQGVVFYIVEEAVNNARKHAQAANIWVRLKSAGEDLVAIEIQDDGKGFNLESVNSSYENRGSLGMVNMRERTELLNGIIQIETAPQKGTLIKVIIPLAEAAADHLRRGN
jgi:signal transduction histidine kinase